MTVSNMPADLTLTHQQETGQEFVRIEARDGLYLKAQIELSLEDFSRFLLGQPVTARFSQGRDI